jgi:hypothetical protein
VKVINTVLAGLIRARVALVLFAVTLIGALNASATPDTGITAMVEDMTTVWGAVKLFVLGLVAFFLLLGVVKLARRK